MKLLTAKEIKKIVIGIVLSDGSIDMVKHRFDLYTKEKQYAEYVYNVLSQITGMSVTLKVKSDQRGYIGYRVWTNKHPYWKNIGEKFYKGRKKLNSYITSRLDAEALAHIWMCDGYLEHAKNRRKNTVQNIGWFCLEAFPKDELELFAERLRDFGIESSFVKKPWGFGYRLRIGGKNLQKFISIVYPHILECFSYKTSLFYKDEKSAEILLPSAEHFIKMYNGVDDIVRYLEKSKKT